MDEKQAKAMYEKYLVNKCPVCKADEGKLCESKAVWIHFERLQLLKT